MKVLDLLAEMVSSITNLRLLKQIDIIIVVVIVVIVIRTCTGLET